MKLKKIPYYVAPWFLMVGASLTIGLLSFSGFIALWPIIPLALAGFVLTVAYEGEIYLQNIQKAFKKLFKSNQLERQLGRACLLECFPKEPQANDVAGMEHYLQQKQHLPQFLKDYEHQLFLLHRFEGKRLDKASKKRQRHVEKKIGDMEKWFAQQLFSEQAPATTYQQQLRDWLEASSKRRAFKERRDSRHIIYQLLLGFCSLSGLFMGVGTSYLLVEAFAIIPWLAMLPAVAIPIFIVPMAAIAGIAYGFLVYNAITDMIASEMAVTWFNKLKTNLSSPETRASGIAKACVLSVMFLVTIALSLCTAGTWWTVAKNTKPLFAWMRKIPAFVMLVLNPLILSLSTWAFNAENISETLTAAEPYLDKWFGITPAEEVIPQDEPCEGFWSGKAVVLQSVPNQNTQERIIQSNKLVFAQHDGKVFMWYCNAQQQCIKTMVNNPKILQLLTNYLNASSASEIKSVMHLNDIKRYVLSRGMTTETWLQRMNPFRFVVDQLFEPLCRFLFTGHVASIGATADQVPGVAPILPTLIGSFSEGIEDMHYFKMSKDTPHEHKHDLQSLLEERLGSDAGHDHGDDLPRKLLFALFSPIYFLAATWDMFSSNNMKKYQSWRTFAKAWLQSWNKETGVPEEESVELPGVDPVFDASCCPPTVDSSEEKTPKAPSLGKTFDITAQKPRVKAHVPKQKSLVAWQFEQAAFRIERFEEKKLQGNDENTQQQKANLLKLKQELHAQSNLTSCYGDSGLTVDTLINNNGFFSKSIKNDTASFLDALPARVGIGG